MSLHPDDMEQFKWLVAQIRDRMETKFFGEIHIKFQRGQVTIVNITQQEKPPKLDPDR